MVGCAWLLGRHMAPTHDRDRDGWFRVLVFSLRGLFVVCRLRYDRSPVRLGDSYPQETGYSAAGRLGRADEAPRAPSRPSGPVDHCPDQLGGRLTVKGAEQAIGVDGLRRASAATHRRRWRKEREHDAI